MPKPCANLFSNKCNLANWILSCEQTFCYYKPDTRLPMQSGQHRAQYRSLPDSLFLSIHPDLFAHNLHGGYTVSNDLFVRLYDVASNSCYPISFSAFPHPLPYCNKPYFWGGVGERFAVQKRQNHFHCAMWICKYVTELHLKDSGIQEAKMQESCHFHINFYSKHQGISILNSTTWKYVAMTVIRFSDNINCLRVSNNCQYYWFIACWKVI